jgi:uncharacterized protein
MKSFTPTERTTLRRLPKRAEYDRQAVYRILDEGFVCHVSFVVDGKPVVIPTSYWRIGDELYIHGSAASRMLREIESGVDVCVAVTLVDGLVLARSAFHHSINYRSVVVFGRATPVADLGAKSAALEAFVEHIIAGRWKDVRRPTESELKATTVLRLPLVEASAKVRTGGPIDDEEDYNLSVWAGVLPLGLSVGEPIPDSRLQPGTEPPDYARNYARGSRERGSRIED